MLLTPLLVVVASCALSPVAARLLRRDAGWLLALPLAVAAALVAVALTGPLAGGPPEQTSLPWLPTLGIGLDLRLDGLSGMFALLVLVIGAGVLAYSARYLGRGRHISFYLLMTFFALAMLLLVLTDDVVVMFVAWELTTLCSFFLIARSGPEARPAAIRTLLVTAAGGLALLSAVVVMVVTTQTTRLSEILVSPAWDDAGGALTATAVLLAVAAFTKSAQFPFQAWLPDSMVAITPVSAYLHAAAMVKAGIYLLLRFSPLTAGVEVWTVLLIGSGLVTALLGATAALRRHDLKELLAYSTISQLGLLVVMIGIGTEASLEAAVLHTVAHALFKAALFMLVGVVDHRAHTRDLRRLAEMDVRLPVTVTAMALAAASMAGVPLLLGFVSKETLIEASLQAPGPLAVLVTVGVALTSVLTFAYSARLVLGAAGGRHGEPVREGSPLTWGVPVLLALACLVLGLLPGLLDALVGAGTSATVGEPVEVGLSIWHGFNLALLVSALVIGSGTVLVLNRHRVSALLAPHDFPVSGLAVVEATRAGIISLGARVGSLSGTRSPRRHLALPVAGVCLIGVVALLRLEDLPPVAGPTSRPTDWVLVALVAGGVLAATRVRTRIAAVVVVGVAGFAMTLWFLALGATDVALTQLLVEILTVGVMVLVLRRLPARFDRPRWTRQLGAGALALLAGALTVAGVWTLTGRRELSPAAEYYLTQAESVTGGSNLVNVILVDYRALDTLGELTVLGVAGLVVAALLQARRASPPQRVPVLRGSPLSDPGENGVFVRTAARGLVPLVVLLSVALLLRGHYDVGGGFVAALAAGAGFVLVYLAAPSDTSARVRWPYLLLIGLGVVVGTGTGLLGYLAGSFLAPFDIDPFGLVPSTLVFDVGVYLAVLGVLLAALNLLGRGRGETPDPADGAPGQPSDEDPDQDPRPSALDPAPRKPRQEVQS